MNSLHESNLPDDYLNVVRSGVLDLHTGVRLSEYNWMTLQEIAGFQWPYQLSDRFVPFANSAGGHYLGWWKSADSSSYECVILAYRDSEAEVFAPDFSGFLYRIMLWECFNNWFAFQDDGSVEMVEAILLRNLDLLKPFLRVEWEATLSAIIARKPFPGKGQTNLNRKEERILVASEFGSGYINSYIDHHNPQLPVAPPVYLGTTTDDSGALVPVLEREDEVVRELLNSIDLVCIAARKLIVLEPADTHEQISNKIFDWMQTYRDSKPTDSAANQFVFTFGDLWGESFRAGLDWHWAWIAVGKCERYGIISPSRNCAVLPRDCLWGLLKNGHFGTRMRTIYSAAKLGQCINDPPYCYAISGLLPGESPAT